MQKIEIGKLDDEQLKVLIHNYERLGQTRSSAYFEAVAELDRRTSHGLSIQTTVNFLKGAASLRRYVSYGDVAQANGMQWTKVRRLMPKHLDNVLSFCHGNNIPYLTAIVVSQPNVGTGRFDESNLKGFTDGLIRLGLIVNDRQQLAEEEQRRVFHWASSNS